ncbi:MAG: pyruvate, orthophosphate dikinase, partial [Gaiellales bacterium]|nr:pyruvate, orthophosphate dikinase [Gaiellales bacterium]
MTRYVYDFSEGSADMRPLLGGKGANLAEMTSIGLPVPDGFTVTTEACISYLGNGGRRPDGLDHELATHLAALEERTGKKLGARNDPLLVSVRSGAVVSMPGMMDTILNLGMNDESVQGLAEAGGGERFAYDSYRRFIQMFGDVVAGVDGHLFEDALAKMKLARGASADVDLTADDLKRLVEDFRRIYREEAGEDFPQDPAVQLDRAVDAVFASWNTPRARTYRREYHIADDLGTAVNVVQMVFGNKGERSGTGVAFTRDPSTGESGIYGEFLANAQGEDVVAGIRTPEPVAAMADVLPAAYEQLIETFKGTYAAETGDGFPQDASEQLARAVRSVFDSWDTPRALVYRR